MFLLPSKTNPHRSANLLKTTFSIFPPVLYEVKGYRRFVENHSVTSSLSFLGDLAGEDDNFFLLSIVFYKKAYYVQILSNFGYGQSWKPSDKLLQDIRLLLMVVS